MERCPFHTLVQIQTNISFIKQTRNINMYEADYNFFLKINLSEAMKKAEHKMLCINPNLDVEKEIQHMTLYLLRSCNTKQQD
jgi:hypothetical protein